MMAMFVNESGRNEQFQFIWPCGIRGEDFLEINQSETRMACGGHVCQRIGTKFPSKDACYQVVIHLAKRFRGEDFLEINQSETRMACGGHVC